MQCLGQVGGSGCATDRVGLVLNDDLEKVGRRDNRPTRESFRGGNPSIVDRSLRLPRFGEVDRELAGEFRGVEGLHVRADPAVQQGPTDITDVFVEGTPEQLVRDADSVAIDYHEVRSLQLLNPIDTFIEPELGEFPEVGEPHGARPYREHLRHPGSPL